MGLRQIFELKLSVVKPNVDLNLRDVVEASTELELCLKRLLKLMVV
jgi:hypothetical protein